MLDDDERLSYSLSSRRTNGQVTFLVEYWDPREPRWVVTAIAVRVDELPESDHDTYALLLGRIGEDIGQIGFSDVEALSLCMRMADDMLAEINGLRRDRR